MDRMVAAALHVMAAAALLAPAPSAMACAVCGGNTPEESKMAFIITTGLLTFLPLLMLGSVAYWIRKRVRELEGEATPTNDPRPSQLG